MKDRKGKGKLSNYIACCLVNYQVIPSDRTEKSCAGVGNISKVVINIFIISSFHQRYVYTHLDVFSVVVLRVSFSCVDNRYHQCRYQTRPVPSRLVSFFYYQMSKKERKKLPINQCHSS